MHMEIQFLKRGENFSGVIYISKNNSEVVGNGERVVTAFAVKQALQGVGLILFSEKGRALPFHCGVGNIWCSH